MRTHSNVPSDSCGLAERQVPSPEDAASETEFDRATSLDLIGKASYAVEITDRWRVIGGAPNGGYLATLVLRAMRMQLAARGLDLPDPLTSTGHFVTAATPDPARIDIEVVRTGKRHATLSGRLTQDGHERLRVLATFGNLDRATGPTVETSGPPPDLPPLQDCQPSPARVDAPLLRRFELRFIPGTIGGAVGEPSGEAIIGAWMRFADGRQPDALALPLFADALPPAALNVSDAVLWIATVELTVHVRRRPVEGWLRAQFETKLLLDGYLEEDGQLWDADDNLVAISRQLAVMRGSASKSARPASTEVS